MAAAGRPTNISLDRSSLTRLCIGRRFCVASLVDLKLDKGNQLVLPHLFNFTLSLTTLSRRLYARWFGPVLTVAVPVQFLNI